MKLTKQITMTISAAALCAILTVPAVAGTSVSGPDQSGDNISDLLLLSRGGNGHGGGDSNSGGGNGDQDHDRDRDGSCLDNAMETTGAMNTILAGNGKGSGDQDRDQSRDGSCS